MYYQRTYLDKCATIVNGSSVNTGLNPVSDLLFGRNVSRLLIHFDHSKLKKLINDKVYPDLSKIHHVLKMTNAGSIDMSELHKVYESKIDGDSKRRASSFDLVFFLIPELWDCGKGFDYTMSNFNGGYYDKNSYDYKLYLSKEGVNWYNCRSGYKWLKEISYKHTKNNLLDFYIKSDTDYLPATGGTIEFTYYCTCNNNYINTDLKLEEKIRSTDTKITIDTPIYFADNGQICKSDYLKDNYCAYIKAIATIPNNTSKSSKKIPFVLKYEIGDKIYQSNPYYIMQLGTDEEFYPQESDGIYTTRVIEQELAKFNNGEESIVIAKQHFDVGDENINVDITDTVNKFISEDLPNYGIGIAYAPDYEYSDSEYENYVGILTNKTNTFFEPYLETTYDEIISDDRANFVLGKSNKLYLYSNINGNLENLDELPTCTVDDSEYEVKQATKGVYYIDISLPISGNTSPIMHYDVWNNIIYQGQTLPSVELDFTTQSPYTYFGVGNTMPERNAFTPTVYGISDNEIIKRGDLRKLCFLIKKNYTQNSSVNIDNIESRLYILDGTAQLDVIPYTKINKAFSENYMMIDTSILIPQDYYVDVKINYGMESIEHHDVLHFKIVNDTNNKYE